MKRRFVLALLVVAGCLGSAAQAQPCDTLRVLVANLLFYGRNNSFCDPACKDDQIRQLLAVERPDLIGFNEIWNNTQQGPTLAAALRANVLNAGPQPPRYDCAPIHTVTFHPLVNALCFDSTRLGFLRYETANLTWPRLDLYKLYFKAQTLATLADTVFLFVGVLHQKAGTAPADEAQRDADMQLFIDLLDRWHTTHGPIENLILMGDFNGNSHLDPGYAPLLTWSNATGQLVDPVNRPGVWYNNAAFADLHTQSTRTTSETDNGVTGGCDDRYDHILCSRAMIDRTHRMGYVPGSYAAVGQDGTFFNQSVLNGGHPLRQVLHRLSDHLPVRAEVLVCGVQPLALDPFEADAQQDEWAVYLRWRTPADVLACQPQRSTDLHSWQPLTGEQPCTGQYADRQPPTGRAWYRIAGFDRNGQPRLSNLLQIDRPKALISDSEVPHPNPFDDWLELPAAAAGIRVYDARGREQARPSGPRFDTRRWPAGFYVVEWWSGGRTHRAKVLKR